MKSERSPSVPYFHIQLRWRIRGSTILRQLVELRDSNSTSKCCQQARINRLETESNASRMSLKQFYSAWSALILGSWDTTALWFEFHSSSKCSSLRCGVTIKQAISTSTRRSERFSSENCPKRMQLEARESGLPTPESAECKECRLEREGRQSPRQECWDSDGPDENPFSYRSECNPTWIARLTGLESV